MSMKVVERDEDESEPSDKPSGRAISEGWSGREEAETEPSQGILSRIKGNRVYRASALLTATLTLLFVMVGGVYFATGYI